MTSTTTPKLSLAERKQTGMLDALNWIGQNLALLAVGPYTVAAHTSWDSEVGGVVGEVSAQGKPGTLQTLVTATAAVPDVEEDERADGAYRHWTALVGDVRVRLVEEAAL